jgi:hypothetical protein
MADDGVRVYRVRVFADGVRTRSAYVADEMDGFYAINRLACFVMQERPWQVWEQLGGSAATQEYHFSLCVLKRGDKHDHTIYSSHVYTQWR